MSTPPPPADHDSRDWTFVVDDFFGSTPEMLGRLERGLVTSRVLAGTIREVYPGDGAEALTQQVLTDEGIGTELEDEARASNTRSLGAKLDRDDLGPVDPAFAWKNNPSIPPLSIAEGLLRTATLYGGHDVPEAWHLLAQFATQTGRPTHVQRSYLQTALRLERARPVRPLRGALALP